MKTRTVIILIFLLAILVGGAYAALKSIYPLEYTEYISHYSEEFSVDPYLVAAVIKAESGFDKNAVSGKGAMGLMQIMESTAHWGAEQIGIDDFTTEDLFKPQVNIRLGCWYLGRLIFEFGNEELAILAYNSGSGTVKGWLQDGRISSDGKNLENIPYKETEQFIKRVKQNISVYKILYRNLGER